MNSDGSSTRLNKFLALHVGVSRRQADELIEKRRVTVDGVIAILGAHIQPESIVAVDGNRVDTATELVYLALNKPIGYVCSRRAQGEHPTIYSLLPDSYHHLKPVGRLDRDSSGLILLTNDGDFAQRMTHPRYRKVKQYNVTLDKPLEPLHQQMISDFGIDLDDGKSQFIIEKVEQHERPARALGGGAESVNSLRTEVEGQAPPMYIVVMSEGRNRQIRRTFTALGYTVTALHRTDFGPYTLGDLKVGDFAITSIK